MNPVKKIIGAIAWPVLTVWGWLYGLFRPGNPYGLDSHEATKDTKKNDGKHDGH